jgi:hypothetical protein
MGRLLLAGLVLSAGAYRFMALACVDLDANCPNLAPGPGLAVAATAPPTAADVVALVKRPLPAGGVPAPASPWLVAVGPLQAAPQADAGPRLRSLKLEGARLAVELDYTPYNPVGVQLRRHVPSYPVALVALPPLPSGAVDLSVRWVARDPATPPTLLGPLRLLVP